MRLQCTYVSKLQLSHVLSAHTQGSRLLLSAPRLTQTNTQTHTQPYRQARTPTPTLGGAHTRLAANVACAQVGQALARVIMANGVDTHNRAWAGRTGRDRASKCSRMVAREDAIGVCRSVPFRAADSAGPVSYTHLTLPTN